MKWSIWYVLFCERNLLPVFFFFVQYISQAMPSSFFSFFQGEDAEEKFQSIATAYEILRDEEERENYNYMLDNPGKVL